MESAPTEQDVQQLLESLRPPDFPDEVFDERDPALGQIVDWKRSTVSSQLAGLLTEPRCHANNIRLDWLQRLVLSKANGRRKPRPHDLSRALNEGLGQAGVLRLEDPIEDLFCDRISTKRGDFRIFTGLWEGAGPYTQTLLDAFETLPAGRTKDRVLTSVYALLRLSDELAERAGVDRSTASSGTPNGDFLVPSAEELKLLSRRVRFSDSDLIRLNIDKNALTPFLLQAADTSAISDRPAGETPLEFYPLQAIPSGIVVLNPPNISIALRAVLVNVAREGGMGEALQYALLVKQEEYADGTGFWPMGSVRLSPPNQFMLRASVSSYAPGRFLHVIQIPATFDDFPYRGFASVRELGREASQFIAQDVERFWQFLAGQPDYRLGVTVLLLGGWGTPQMVEPPIREASAPDRWVYLPLPFIDASVLGACKHGKLRHIVRMMQQVERLERDGFTFQYVNGTVNLFGFWRTTHGNLIPEHVTDVEPPYSFYLPTDELLAPRREAAQNRDIRALPTLADDFKVTQRTNWSNPDNLSPVYASLDDARHARMLGAAVFAAHVWWIECTESGAPDVDATFRAWDAILQWLSVVGPPLLLALPDIFPAGPRVVEVRLPTRALLTEVNPAALSQQNARAALTVVPSTHDAPARVEVAEAWLEQLGATENYAEVELIAAILEALSNPGGATREVLAEQVQAAIGSADWRWLHIRQSISPLDHLVGVGLVQPLREPSFSAHALTKCQSIWSFRDRQLGNEIAGEDNCKQFLTTYRATLLARLIAAIRPMDRKQLVVACGQQYQAARADQSQWRSTIRAMRAIRGTAADNAAFERQNAMNGIQRAAKTVCEVAACEASGSGGLVPHQEDLDELFALAILLVSTGQFFALMSAGLHEPTLRISPAGDLLGDHSVQTNVLRPSAELMNRRILDEAAESYESRRSHGEVQASTDQGAWSPALCAAIQAEYQTSVDAFVNLQYTLARIAEARREGTFTIRRDELVEALKARQDFHSAGIEAFLQRLTLPHRPSWLDIPKGRSEADFNLSRFDRPYSLINRPLVALEDDANPLVLVAPGLVADACMYSWIGLREGTLNNAYWVSDQARAFAGAQGHAMGEKFEDDVSEQLRKLGLQAWTRRNLSWALNMKVDPSFGNIDVLAISADKRRLWVIEAKNLRLCRTETEIASRMSEYRGRTHRDKKGRETPDKMLRHIRRVEFMRTHASRLCSRLELNAPPEVKGLLVVDAPQPMNFLAAEQFPDGQTEMLDTIERFQF